MLSAVAAKKFADFSPFISAPLLNKQLNNTFHRFTDYDESVTALYDYNVCIFGDSGVGKSYMWEIHTERSEQWESMTRKRKFSVLGKVNEDIIEYKYDVILVLTI